jgi:toxin ParE1/3/4
LKKIVWTDEAVVKLIEIEEYISQASPERAAKFVESIVDHVETILPGNFEIGRTVPETENMNIRELIFRKYRIVYRMSKNKIEILTVFEGHRLFRIEEIKQ